MSDQEREDRTRSETLTPEMKAKLERASMSVVDRVIRFCLEQKLVVALILGFLVMWGVLVAPFDWDVFGLQRSPVAVDAIPDIGEKQQIVFTEWPGRSPQDVEDQVTYPLTVTLLGVTDVKTIRSTSMFGFSSIYVIFEDQADFYASRTRVLEKLNSLPAGMLPPGVQPQLGPDATALGQIFWYTLEGRDPQGKPVGGWGPEELRSIQDWQVRYQLQAVKGVSEAASVGGYVREYQIDVDPDAMRAYRVGLHDVYDAVKKSNVDVGARTIELNRVEYLIRGLGFIRSLKDIEDTVITSRENVPVYIRDVARVSRGPELRIGALDKDGVEAAGGVVVVRYGYNPLEAIKAVREKIDATRESLPVKAWVDFGKVTRAEVERFGREHDFTAMQGDEINQEAWMTFLTKTPREDWPGWVTTSRVTVAPFYDRTTLIHETLGTLKSALTEEILITIIVVVVMTFHLRSSVLISASLPLAVLGAFIIMWMFKVDANLVSLSGIAIAIGTVVDMGIIMCENILKHLEEAKEEERRVDVIFRASSEVGSAVLTAIATTVVGFLPVFFMTGPEGKLFKPLAFTKTFALIASLVVALTIVPAGAHVLFGRSGGSRRIKDVFLGCMVAAGVALLFFLPWWAGTILILMGGYNLVVGHTGRIGGRVGKWVSCAAVVILVGWVLTRHWMPLGVREGMTRNLLFVGVMVGGFLGFYWVFQRFYEPILRWVLKHKLVFLMLPAGMVLVGLMVWLGFNRVMGFVPATAQRVGIAQEKVKETTFWVNATKTFPGLGREFMPPLDEGSYLYMPTTMPHASIGEAVDVLSLQDKAIRSIPEVESVVGKIGRAQTALDPAPVSMIETVVTYKPEYKSDESGYPINYRYDERKKEFVLDEKGELIEDVRGRPYRQWREGIRGPDDIWEEITRAAKIPGTTNAPKLQPIAARIVMLQTGMRAPMGIKVKGDSLEKIERYAVELERFVRQVPSVEPDTVIADRIVGKPYWEIEIDRTALARYGLAVRDVQDVIEVAMGGVRVTTTVEGRERYPVRVRYLRELRDQIETMERILVPTMSGQQIPLTQLTDIHYVRGPMSIKSEDTFLVGYLLFDKKPQFAEVDVVEAVKSYLDAKEASGELRRPQGVEKPEFAGSYENQVRANKTLMVVLPGALFVIFMILYLQFRHVPTTFLVFLTIAVCWGAGFIMIWLYGQPWFLDFEVWGVNLRDLFHLHQINLSVAIWVGFLALFGIASDDGVVMMTYLNQRFTEVKPGTRDEVREATVFAGNRRIRACLMTTATTVLALLPVLTSTGRGADIMIPMAIPSFGGMLLEVVTLFTVPVMFSWMMELKVKHGWEDRRLATGK